MLEYEFMKFIEEYMWIYKDFLLPIIICDSLLTVYWSNNIAKIIYPNLIESKAMRRFLGEFDSGELLARLKRYGICRIETRLLLGKASLNLTPIMYGGEVEGITAWFIGSETLPASPGEIVASSKTPVFIEKSIREKVEEIFNIMDAAALKSDILDAGWIKKSLNGIARNGYYLLRIASNISNYTRYISSPDGLSAKAVDIFALLRQTEPVVTSIAAEMGIPIRYDFPEDKIFAAVDPDKFQLAFINILHNSLYFTKPENSIDVTGKINETGISVIVRDRGEGIPPDVMPRIYDPYFSSGHDGRPAGIGLGLTVAKMIIESYGGVVAVESKERDGTTVTLSLPSGGFSSNIALSQSNLPYDSLDRFSYIYVGIIDAAGSPYNIAPGA